MLMRVRWFNWGGGEIHTLSVPLLVNFFELNIDIGSTERPFSVPDQEAFRWDSTLDEIHKVRPVGLFQIASDPDEEPILVLDAGGPNSADPRSSTNRHPFVEKPREVRKSTWLSFFRLAISKGD
jgi:hypothetical protein